MDDPDGAAVVVDHMCRSEGTWLQTGHGPVAVAVENWEARAGDFALLAPPHRASPNMLPRMRVRVSAITTSIVSYDAPKPMLTTDS